MKCPPCFTPWTIRKSSRWPFYCKAATSLVKTYYAQRPDFQGQEERLDKEIGRIKNWPWCRGTRPLYTCRTLEESLLKEKADQLPQGVLQ